MPRMTTFRIGSGAGYSGDRIDPAQDLAERGALNALVFECLAERTIALAQLRRSHDPQAGYDPLLAARMRAVLPACVKQGVTIITNMGAANPLAAGHALLQVARELGLPASLNRPLRVAVVTGDDVLAWMQAHDAPLMDSNDTVRSLDGQLISANAYLGADALLPALRSGADVVITGRVADPALFLAPLMHHFGWQPDDWQRMGQGIAVGHLLECAAQVSGGYIADPGHVDIPDLATVLGQIELSWLDVNAKFKSGDLPIHLGRVVEAEFVVNDQRVSRLHAKIEWRNGTFVLSDLSSYGTWVRFTGSDTELALRRDECVLHGKGEIALGAPFSDFTVPTVSFNLSGSAVELAHRAGGAGR